MTVPVYADAYEAGDAGGLIAQGEIKQKMLSSSRLTSWLSLRAMGRWRKVPACPSLLLSRRQQQSAKSPVLDRPILTFWPLVPNTYSAALSIQALHPVFEKVPRAIWYLL